MIKFFKTNDPYRFVFLAILFVAVRTLIYFFDIPLTQVELKYVLVAKAMASGKWLYRDIWETAEPLTSVFYYLLYSSSGFLHKISFWINTALIITNAFLLNSIIQRFEVLSEKSYLPAFFYMFLSLSFVELNVLSAPLLCSTFCILVFGNFFSYLKKEESRKMYDAGFYLGLASLFFLPSLLFILSIVTSLLFFSRSTGKAYFLFLLGCLFPWLIVCVIYLINDGFGDLFAIFFRHYFNSVRYTFSFSEVIYIVLTPGVVLLLGIVLNLRTYLREINYQSICRKFFTLWLLSGIAFFALNPAKSLSYCYLLIIPGAFFFTFYFSNLKKPFLINSVVLGAIVVMVMFQYMTVKKGFWSKTGSLLFVAPVNANYVSDKNIWVAGFTTSHYLHSSISTKYLNWDVSKDDFNHTERFKNIENIRRELYRKLPDIIFDEFGIMPKLILHLPSLEKDYKLTQPGIYELQRK